jgi:hypothetical protein
VQFIPPPTQLSSDTPSSQPISRLSANQDPELPSASTLDPNETPDGLLNVFRGQMAANFPFVVVPEGAMARSLQESKPFLFSVITMVASYLSPGRQMLMRKEIMRNLSEQVLIEGKKSLDLLQGILVFISWYVLFNVSSTGRPARV